MVRFNKQFIKVTLVIFLILTGRNTFIKAQGDSTKNLEFFKLSFEDLIKTNENFKEKESVFIATQTETSLKESPGIVTVISREEIEQSGAQDLMELLKLVPGVDFGSDAQNVIGLSVRGNWAFEGKVLITVDGQMINETSYGTFAFGQRILLDNVEKVEIIRGPGSAIYGGVAGLAVINVITKKGQGFQSSHSLSLSNGRSRQNTQFQIGQSFENDFSISVSGSYNQGNLSNRTLNTSSNSIINYRDSSQVQSYFLNTTLKYKRFIFKYFFDEYSSKIIESAGKTKFGGHFMNLQYQQPINYALSISPQILFTRHTPWDLIDVPDNNFNLTNSRITGRIQVLYEPSPIFSLISGFEGFYDNSTITTAITESTFNNGEPVLEFQNLAFYNQAIFKSKIVNITAGLRMDAHSAFGIAFAPRFAITKLWEKWHAKMLYSSAFKAPTLQNLDSNVDIKPERINTSEFEVGYEINKRNAITANLFYIVINNEIIYKAIDDIIDHYENGTGTGTTGGELSYKVKFPRGTFSTNYSYNFNINRKPESNIDENQPLNPVFAAHKIVLQTHYKINRSLFLNTSSIYFSNKFSHNYIDDESYVFTIPQSFTLNMHLKYNNFIVKGLDGYIGLNNLFNSNYFMIHPYETMESPIPSQSRELFMKLSFNFNN